jgi:hypothetical protein
MDGTRGGMPLWLGVSASVTRFGLRLFIALILLATAVGKLLDVPGFAQVIGTYRVFPDFALTPLAWAIPLGEVVLGAWLLLGRGLFTAALSSAAMHAGYAAWAALALIRGLAIKNCGCFGVFFQRPLTPTTVLEDAVMVALSVALFALARGASSRREQKDSVERRRAVDLRRDVVSGLSLL